ncbi:GA2OX2, partial [Symbiodinium pilosum]
GLQFSAMAVLCYRKQEALLRFRTVYYLMIFRPFVLLTIQLNLLTDINTQWAMSCLKEASMWWIYWQLLVALQPTYRIDLFMLFASGTWNGGTDSTNPSGEFRQGRAAVMPDPQPDDLEEPLPLPDVVEEVQERPGQQARQVMATNLDSYLLLQATVQ